MKPSFQISAFAWLALNFLGYYCAFGVVQPFFSLWLQSHHYSEFFIAFVMSSAYLFRFGGGLWLSKRVQRLDALLPTIRWATWGSVLALLAEVLRPLAPNASRNERLTIAGLLVHTMVSLLNYSVHDEHMTDHMFHATVDEIKRMLIAYLFAVATS